MSTGPAQPPPGPPPGATTPTALDEALLAEFSRLNNELVNLQRELVQKNVELQDGAERYRLLNLELEDRVVARTRELERARAEAERANEAKSAFLAMMCHELRTPMNGVVGSIDLLRETGVTDEQRELLELLRRSALAQLSLLEDLIDVSQGEVGTIELESMPLQLGEAIHGVSAMLERDAADRGLSISVFVDPAIPPKLLGDARRIRQVLFNLVKNAIKFSGGGTVRGEVTLRALLAARESDVASIDLVVADRGIGMDTATVEKLFSPFSQADASITRRHGGTGTGLALSSMLVRRMGGTLSVESVPGQGSTFTARLRLRLPPAPAAARRPGPPGASARRPLVPPVPVPSQEEARRQGRLVLVAEDNDMNRRVIARQMELIGFAVQLAVDGREALERWRSGDFGLLLTDLHMPELDGYALATAIRAEEKGGPRKPIIALTANSLRDEALRCFAAGIDAYLTKPVQLPRLKAAIEAGLAGTLADAEWKAV